MFGKKKMQGTSIEDRGASCAQVADERTSGSHSRPSPLAPRPSRRRGVLLLVVLSLLVLFMMIGTAFIVSTKQFEKGAKASQRAALKASDAASHEDLLDEVLMQLVRDTNNPNSSLHYHSLLEDMYGLDGWRSQIPPAEAPLAMLLAPEAVPYIGNGIPTETLPFTVRWPDNGMTGPGAKANVTGNQILEFDVVKFNALYEAPHETRSPKSTAQPGDPYPHTSAEFSPLDDAYAGQVLTFTSGPARGVSTWIVGSRFTQASGANWLTLRVQAFKLPDGSQLPITPAGLQQQLAGARFIVNGRPFNGTGAGFRNTANPDQSNGKARLSFAESFNALLNGPQVGSYPLALMPNTAFFGASAGPNNPTILPFENVTTSSSDYFLNPGDLAGIDSHFPPYQNIAGNLNRLARLRFRQMIGWNGRGGGDESYDIPDFQNMALAMVPSGATPLQETVWPDVTQAPPSPQSNPPGNLGTMVLPSFHRPDLINYWNNVRGSNLPANFSLLRRIMLRPSWWDHPNFTGSNPDVAPLVAAFNAANASQQQAASANLVNRMIYGPWDVDNDHDGVRDSIWVDFGAPVMIGPEGKLVRPLAAILCVDMDGRVNVNTAGTLDIAAEAKGDDWTISTFGQEPNHRNVAVGATNGPATIDDSEDLPRGMGATPGDISLEPAIGAEDFKDLLVGDVQGRWPGRYGPDQLPGYAGFDVMAQVNRYAWADRADQRSSIGSPLDVIGRYAVGVNIFGQPVYEADEVSGNTTWTLRQNAPTEFDVTKDGTRGMVAGAADMPYSVAELERALRMFDADAGSLPRRLYDLSGTSKPDEYVNRLRITTDSNDVPAPNFQMPQELLYNGQTFTGMMRTANDRPPQSVAELIEARVRKRLLNQSSPVAGMTLFGALLPGPPTAPATPAGQVRRIVRQILAPELAAGLRLDVNRPLGNGRDDNRNDVVDEPGEWDANQNGALDPGEGEMVWDPTMSTGTAADSFTTAPFTPLDVNDDGIINEIDATQQRQLLARHLYVLALTMTAPANYDTGAQTGNTNPSATQKDHQALARRLAQWAVNIVDFRDADNIMTPFEYDLNPFDGWDVDGDFRTVADHDPDNSLKPNGQGIPQGADSGDETVVWGLERPELVMTETLAWHDRRTDDSGQADTYPTEDGPDQLKGEGNPPEMDYDQLVRPRGALFVELYNPWPSNLSANADTHRLKPGGGGIADAGVDLGRTHDGTQRGSPVWRMAIYKRATESKTYSEFDAEAWDPDDPDPKRRPQFNIDRSVYFTAFDPDVANGAADWDADGGAFFSYPDPANPQQSAVPPVRPGRFLVVGPGEATSNPGIYEMPLADRKGDRNTNVPEAEKGPRRRIELNANNVAHTVRLMDAVEQGQSAFDDTDEKYLVQSPSERNNGVTTEPSYPGDTSQSFTDVAIINRATAAVAEPKNNVQVDDVVKRNLSVSEPAAGYPYKFRAAEWREDDQVYKSAQNAPTAIDIPLDGPIGGGAVLDANLNGTPRPSYLKNVDPVLTTIRDGEASPNRDPGATYSLIYLQRLANPMLPWNPLPGHQGYNPQLQVNPYLTVDSNSANLTVFNSRGNDSGEEENGLDANRPRRQFASHERGYTAKKQNTDTAFMPELWSTETVSGFRATSGNNGKKIEASPPNRYAPPYRQINLRAANSFWFNAVPHHTLGFMNRSFFDPNEQPAGGPQNDNEAKKVKPRKPFPWLSWNNRPYVSGNELLLAPRSRSSKILRDFTTSEKANQIPYSDELDPVGVNSNPQDKFPFGHLENYFYGGPATPANPPVTNGVPRNLSRVLDYVTTPSLFAGTQNWLNPNAMSATPQELTTGLQADDPRYNRQAPFNAVSEYREPGRMNVNTIASKEVWDCLFHGSAKRGGTGGNKVHAGPDDDQMSLSRRGVGVVPEPPNNGGPGPTTLTSGLPTIFANPFRAQDAGDLVPLDTMVRDGLDATLYRTMDGTTGTAAKRTGDQLFAAITDRYFDEAKRNPYFRYQPMSRLGSMVTTRSNVYAVWVTIGFFEVDEITDDTRDTASQAILTRFGSKSLDTARANPLFNRVYPEGVMLGQEAGAETGDVHRLRGFYILDRSIPAGFEPGKNVNVEKVIRLKRQIE